MASPEASSAVSRLTLVGMGLGGLAGLGVLVLVSGLDEVYNQGNLFHTSLRVL